MRTPRPTAPVLAALLLAAASVSAESPEAALLRRDFPRLLERIPLSEPADFVVVVDASGSMKPFWPTTVQALESFVQSVPDGDYLSLVAFGTFPRHLSTPSQMSGATRAAVVEGLRRLPAPRDAHTDLGTGVERCLDELNRPGGNTLKFIFLLTDFVHDPPKGSAYERAFAPADEPWLKLAKRRSQELRDRTVQVCALLLPLARNVGRDLPLVSSVFPGLRAEAITDRTALAAWFDRRKAELLREKLRARAERDLAAPPAEVLGLRVESSLGQSRGTVLANLGLRPDALVTLEGLRVEPKGLTSDGEADRWLRLSTGAVADVATAPGPTLQSTVGHFELAERPFLRSTRSVPLHLVARLQPLPQAAKEIQRLGIDPGSLWSSVEADATVEMPVGLVPPWALGVAAFLLAGVVVGFLRRRRPEYLVGRVIVVGGSVRRFKASDKLRRAVVGDPSQPGGIAVPGAAWRLEFRGFRAGEEGQPRRGIYARLEGQAGAYTHRGRERPLGAGWSPAAKGTVFRIEASRIEWS